jgi:hypothetical protein
MARLAGRKVTKKDHPEPSEVPFVAIDTPAVNLVVTPAVVQPVATLGVQPTFLGAPIMREGFITTTGHLLS